MSHTYKTPDLLAYYNTWPDSGEIESYLAEKSSGELRDYATLRYLFDSATIAKMLTVCLKLIEKSPDLASFDNLTVPKQKMVVAMLYAYFRYIGAISKVVLNDTRPIEIDNGTVSTSYTFHIGTLPTEPFRTYCFLDDINGTLFYLVPISKVQFKGDSKIQGFKHAYLQIKPIIGINLFIGNLISFAKAHNDLADFSIPDTKYIMLDTYSNVSTTNNRTKSKTIEIGELSAKKLEQIFSFGSLDFDNTFIS